MGVFRSLFEKRRLSGGSDLKKIGARLSRPHCICGYGVPTLQGLVGGGWGRRPWELAGARGREIPTRRKQWET